jgi:membrane protease YdiL (CAAX protease family)
MGFFKRHKGRASYDLLSNYNHFMPGYVDLVWVVLFMFLGTFIGSILAGTFMVGGSVQDAQIFGMLITYPMMFIPAMLYASAKSRRNEGFEDGYTIDNNNFGAHKGITMAFVATVICLATSFIIEPVGMLLPEMPENLKLMMEKLLEGPVWVSFLSTAIFAPFFEEWLCRGVILRGMLKKVSPTWAILISALFFALIHMNIWQGVPAFLMGIVFGYVYYKTGSLKLTMLMHFANNTMALILSNIPSLKDAEYFSDVLSPWAYAGVYAIAAIALTFGIILIKGIPQEEGDLGGCKKIPRIF